MTPKQIEALVEANADWAVGVAGKCSQKLPPWVDHSDLRGPALEGLWQAAQRYDPEFHKAGHAHPVTFRAFAKPYIRHACTMSVRRKEYCESRHDALEDAVHGDVAVQDMEMRRRTELPELCQLLSKSRGCLRGRQARVIRWHFVDGIGLDEIAARMGISRGRVSQIKAEALARLKAWLVERGVRGVEDCL